MATNPIARTGVRLAAAVVLRSMVKRGLRFQVLAFGNPRGDFVITQRRKEVTAAFVRYLRGRARDWDLLVLDDVRADAGTMQAVLSKLGSSRGYR